MKKFLTIILMVASLATVEAATLRGVRVQAGASDTMITLSVIDAQNLSYDVIVLASAMPKVQRDRWTDFVAFFTTKYIQSGETVGAFQLGFDGRQVSSSYGTKVVQYFDKQDPPQPWNDTQRTITGTLRDVLSIGYTRVKTDKTGTSVVFSEDLDSTNRDNLLNLWAFLKAQAALL